MRRRTDQLVRVAVAMMSDPYGRHYGYSLMRAANLKSGTLYPILDRMLSDGWVRDDWETPDQTETRKPRRYYTLTNRGRAELGAMADDALVSDLVRWAL